jgi:hypothetical protein
MRKLNKSILAVLACLLVAAFIISCSKKDTTDTTVTTGNGCPTCSNIPIAAVANNTISKGIYIGVVIGSTGTIKFDIANGGTSATGTLVLDGVTINLISTNTPTAGSAFSATFTGKLNGADVSIKFSVDADGKNPIITLPIIPGHPSAQFFIAKELSTSLIEAYVGTYSSTKPETGTFNMLVNRTDRVWSVIHSASGSTDVKGESGTIVGLNLLDLNGKTIATLSRNSSGLDVVNGTFAGGGSGTEITTVTGTRAL